VRRWSVLKDGRPVALEIVEEAIAVVDAGRIDGARDGV
jgi:hypothetical protein